MLYLETATATQTPTLLHYAMQVVKRRPSTWSLFMSIVSIQVSLVVTLLRFNCLIYIIKILITDK